MNLRRVVWASATRIIASRFPPIDLFERLSADPADWDAFIALESRVNPRIRQEVGEISLVPPDERVSGPGASYVMASFTHLNRKGSRFTNGSYGVYYAGREFETALRETVRHCERFYSDADLGVARREEMRVLVGSIDEQFHDVHTLPPADLRSVMDPDDYAPGQSLAADWRNRASNGFVYPSVRNPGGECLAAFKPRTVGIPVQTKHLAYHWDGARIDRYFDFASGNWLPL